MLTAEQAAAHLLQSDPRFELTEAVIRGVSYKVFRQAPPHLRAFLQSVGQAYDEHHDVLVYQDERWSYPEFCDEVKRLAHAMATQLGVQSGDRVAIAMRNFPEFPILFFAITALGAVAVPMNAWWSADELAFAMADCGARLVFADGPRYERLMPVAERLSLQLVAVRDAEGPCRYADLRDHASHAGWPDVAIAPDDDFAVFYSSGSTGQPKGVVLTHRGAMSAVYSWLMLREIGLLLDAPAALQNSLPRSSWLLITPLFHVTALQSGLLLGLASGAKLSLLYKWDVQEAIRVIKAEQVTRFHGVPTQSADLMETASRQAESLPTLLQIGAGGAKRPAAQVEQLASAFPGAAISTGWGMTETNALGITLAGEDYLAHPEAAGRLTPPLQEARIVTVDGQTCAVGEIGELLVKSPANMRCYLNQPEETAAALQDGWLSTGDLACMDEQGLIYIVDRMKSIIIRGGENISCLEVEGVLHHHPQVAEACVFPVPDQRLGEVVGAVVSLKPGSTVTRQELTAFVADRLAQFKVPEHVWLWTEPLPRGATDKIDRRVLQAQCLAQLSEAELSQ